MLRPKWLPNLVFLGQVAPTNKQTHKQTLSLNIEIDEKSTNKNGNAYLIKNLKRNFSYFFLFGGSTQYNIKLHKNKNNTFSLNKDKFKFYIDRT